MVAAMARSLLATVVMISGIAVGCTSHTQRVPPSSPVSGVVRDPHAKTLAPQPSLSPEERVTRLRESIPALRDQGRILAALRALEALRQLSEPTLDRPLELALCTELGIETRARDVAAELVHSSSPSERQSASAALAHFDDLKETRVKSDLAVARRDLALADELLSHREYSMAAEKYLDVWRRSYPNPVALIMAGLALQRAKDEAGANRAFARALVDAESQVGKEAVVEVLSAGERIAEYDEDTSVEGQCPKPPGSSVKTAWQGNDLAWSYNGRERRLVDVEVGSAILHMEGIPVFENADRAADRPVYWTQEAGPRVVVRSWKDDRITLCDPVADRDLGSVRHPIEIFEFNEGYHGTLTFSSDRRWLVAGANDGIVRVWDTKTLRLVKELRTPKLGALHRVAVSAGKQYIGASDLSTVVVWDARSWRVVDQWAPPTNYLSHYGAGAPLPIGDIAFSDDAKQYATAFTGYVAIRPLDRSLFPNRGTTLIPAPRTFLSITDFAGGAVALSLMRMGALLTEDTAMESLPAAPGFSPDHTHAIAASGDGVALLAASPEWHVVDEVASLNATALLGSNRILFRGVGESVVVRMPSLTWEERVAHVGSLASLSPDGLSVVRMVSETEIAVQGLEGARVRKVIRYPKSGNTRLAATVGAFAVSEGDATSLWRQSGDWLQTMELPGKLQTFSRDGARVIVASAVGVDVRSAVTGELMTDLKGEGIQISPFGRHALVPSEGGWRLVEVDTDQSKRLTDVDGTPWFSDDGRWLITRAKVPKGRTYHLWYLGDDAGTPIRVDTECYDLPLVGANRAVFSRCPNGVIHTWTLTPLRREPAIDKGKGDLSHARLSDDGRYMVAQQDGFATFWDLEKRERTARLIPVAGVDAMVVLWEDGRVEVQGPEAAKGERLLTCRVGPYRLPFATCRDKRVGLQGSPI